MEMVTCEEFERELRGALAHLYDPHYRPSEMLCAFVGCDPQAGVLAFQNTIAHMVESLEPIPNTPSTARTRRIYDVLYNRFVLKLTQEETANRLHMSRSSIQRAQREAVRALARMFWERGQPSTQPPEKQIQVDRERLPGGELPSNQAADWRSQVQRELASLQASAPDTVSDVEEVIGSVLEFKDALLSKLGTDVEVRSVQSGLVSAVHPSVLSQILIVALERLARYAPNGQIAIYARLEDGNVKITLTGTVTAEGRPTESDLIGEILLPEDVSVEVCIDGAQVFLWVEAPAMGRSTVLVVDDNPDMARFYRRSTEGTRYHILHITQGQGLFETIEATEPDIIVLDVMLPDVDGWRLLMRLHEDPATRSIPVIVCSVVKEEALAFSLGAAIYLPKPIRRHDFIQALDQALYPVSGGAPVSQVNSGTTRQTKAPRPS
jgi:CheY-like chemotaxis protein